MQTFFLCTKFPKNVLENYTYLLQVFYCGLTLYDITKRFFLGVLLFNL